MTVQTTPGRPNSTVPGEGQIWKIDGVLFFIYYAPNTDPPVPLAWRVEDENVAAYFGTGVTPAIDRTLSKAQFEQMGGLVWGDAQEIVPTQGQAPTHPWNSLVANWEVETEVRPWLRDPEIAALISAAYLESREVADAEWWGTDWWRTHSESERAALLAASSDPATFEQSYLDYIIQFRDALASAGVTNASDALVEWLANKVVTGLWSVTKINSQIAALSDPGSVHTLDPELRALIGNLRAAGTQQPLDRTQQYEDTVQDTVMKWLGPAFGNWTQKQIQQWAGTLRNDPDGAQKLEELLSRQRMQLFPAYTDPRTTYDDAASVWRNVFQNLWGETADEKDPLFVQIVKDNDLTTATQTLLREGLNRGKDDVVYRTMSDMLKSFGGNVPGGAL